MLNIYYYIIMVNFQYAKKTLKVLEHLKTTPPLISPFLETTFNLQRELGED